jgi:hypothetical protein
MNQRTPDKVIPFAPQQRQAQPPSADPLDQSGLAIVAMLQEAVDVAKENCDRALEVAHKFSLQLRAAEDRILQLEGDVRHYQERATRAEKWMMRIQGEIEERFFRNGGNGHAGNGHSQGNGHAPNGNGYAPNGNGAPRR